MYTYENYIWGLVAYCLGCLLIAPLAWKVTGWTLPWAPVRALVRLFLVAVFLTPVKAYEDMYYLAPAWVVAGFELVRPTSGEGFARAMAALLLSFLGLVCLYGLACLFHSLRRKRRTAGSRDDANGAVSG